MNINIAAKKHGPILSGATQSSSGNVPMIDMKPDGVSVDRLQTVLSSERPISVASGPSKKSKRKKSRAKQDVATACVTSTEGSSNTFGQSQQDPSTIKNASSISHDQDARKKIIQESAKLINITSAILPTNGAVSTEESNSFVNGAISTPIVSRSARKKNQKIKPSNLHNDAVPPSFPQEKTPESEPRENSFTTPSDSSKNNRTPLKAQTRRAVYPELVYPLWRTNNRHYDFETVREGLEAGTLLSGMIRVNKKDRYDSYVTCDGLQEDVRVSSIKFQNRAFDGDKVVVELLNDEELKSELSRLANQKVMKEEMNSERNRKCKILDGEEVDEIVDTNGLQDNEEETPTHLFGKVVYILERRPSHLISGTLSLEMTRKYQADLEKERKVIWFRPLDKRYSFIIIPVELAPSEYLKNPENFEQTIYLASIRSWNANNSCPFGAIEGPLGQMGELSVETQALLNDNGIDWDIFPEETSKCLPQLPWTIPVSEYVNRVDFRHERVFSIDPPTAKDLDDALSIKDLGNGVYYVGVHIADVSYFVRPNNSLDKEAEYRATTIYLVQKAIPMLPRILCEQLCSLNPGVERLAFSVFWKIDSDANIIGQPTFSRTVIKSCAKMSYDHAQALIDGLDLESTTLPVLEIANGFNIKDVENDVIILYKLSLKIRKKRFNAGALTMNNIKLWFSLDEQGNPKECGPYQLKDSNRLIEEFMLLANMAVAKKICITYPEISLLRKHGEPSKKAMEDFVDQAAALGFSIDPSTSKSLQQSFDAITDEKFRLILRMLGVKPMQRAKYFCSGLEDISNFHHYALACPLYTHFTSPIRRYCDIVVHRLLDYSLQGISEAEVEKILLLDSTRVGNIAKWCNLHKEASKNAQDASQKIYLCAYLTKLIKDKTVLIENAVVHKTSDRSFDVIVPLFGIERRVFIEDLIDRGLALGNSFDGKQISIFWKEDANIFDGFENFETDMKRLTLNDIEVTRAKKNAIIQNISVFDDILVRIEVNMKKSPPDIKLYAEHPSSPYAHNFDTGPGSQDEVTDKNVVCLDLTDGAD